MSLLKYIKKKPWYVALFFGLCFSAMLGFEIWEDGADERETSYVDQLLSQPPQQRNFHAITQILNSLTGRDNFRFAVLGDNRYNLKQLKKILQAVAQEKPDFVIHTGDLTSSGKYQQYMQLLDVIRDFKIPIIFILGNHDTNYHGVSCFLHIFGPASFYFDVNKYRFVFIDNTSENAEPEFVKVPDDGVKKEIVTVGLDNYQMNDLEKLIRGSDHNFITLHIPPPVELFRFHCFFKNGDNFISLLQRYVSRIALVFSGHIHGYGEAESGGVHYLVTGGAGASLVKSREGIVGRFNYVLVSVAGNTVTHTVQYVD